MNIIFFLIVGIVAGWLGSLVMGSGGGLLYYLVVGVIGAVLGGWLFSRVNQKNLVLQIAIATLGAIILIFILRLLKIG